MIGSALKDRATDWSMALAGRLHAPALEFRVAQMTPSASEIFTGKLPYTKRYFEALASGAMSFLRGGSGSLTLSDALQVMGVIAAHNHVARTGEFDLVRPGFWVRVPYEEGHRLQGHRRVPVMPLSHLSVLSGRSMQELEILLRPLLEDRAIRLLRNQDKVDGVMLNDGFASMDRFRSAIRF